MRANLANLRQHAYMAKYVCFLEHKAVEVNIKNYPFSFLSGPCMHEVITDLLESLKHTVSRTYDDVDYIFFRLSQNID